MIKQRVLTAAIALPLLLIVLMKAPKGLLIGFLTVCVAIGTWEIAHMLLPVLWKKFSKGRTAKKFDRVLIGIPVCLAVLIFLGSSVSVDAGRGMILFGMLGSILIGCFWAPSNEIAFARTAGYLISIVYGAFPWLAIWELYLMGPESRYIVLLLFIVFGGDTGAYFAGKKFGKHKLAPRMSPNKTWEGSIGGIAASLAGGIAVQLFFDSSLTTWSGILVVSIVGGAFGQMGDLIESTFKRFASVKDSGIIFPGHGGFLDRVDGILFAAPVVWFILYNFRVS
ncbi:MAG: hypothetical protein CMP10_04215 [Zetaproteobacteria bacterium]|nr:hypothetical protein [Pseudobdellovibrionaceae bacterium]